MAYYPRQRQPIVVYAIIAINVVVFFAWYIASLPSTQSDTLFVFMVNNFLVSWAHLEIGHYWVLLTSVFSHEMLLHLLLNMLVLYSFGQVMEVLMGRGAFLRFYLIAGVLSGLAHVGTSYLILNRPDLFALGASGAVAGVLLLFALIFPRHKILLFGIVPIPAIFGALAFIAIDVWGFLAQIDGGGLPIGHGAHLGGAAVGVAYYFLWWRRRATVS